MAETREPKKREPILSLDTLVERRSVLIDGEPYELLNAGELALLDYHRIGKQGERVEKMMAQPEDLDDDQVLELSRLLDSLCKVLLLAPDEVQTRLRDDQKLLVLGAFTNLQRKTKAPAPPAGGKKAPKRGRAKRAGSGPSSTSTGESTSLGS